MSVWLGTLINYIFCLSQQTSRVSSLHKIQYFKTSSIEIKIISLSLFISKILKYLILSILQATVCIHASSFNSFKLKAQLRKSGSPPRLNSIKGQQIPSPLLMARTLKKIAASLMAYYKGQEFPRGENTWFLVDVNIVNFFYFFMILHNKIMLTY